MKQGCHTLYGHVQEPSVMPIRNPLMSGLGVVFKHYFRFEFKSTEYRISLRYTRTSSLFTSSSSSSSSIGTRAHCGLWPVEQCPSIFSYLPPTLAIFSLPELEDLFLLSLSIVSWVFPFFSSLPVLEWRYFWASYLLPFSLGDLTSLSFALLSILLYFSRLLISSSSQFVRLFHSPFSYLGPYILLNIFLSKISTACSSFFVNVNVSAPYDTTGLISLLYNIIFIYS